VAWIVNRRGA